MKRKKSLSMVGALGFMLSATLIIGCQNSYGNDDKPLQVTGVSLNKTTHTIDTGESFTLTATVAPLNATNKGVTWASDNESVVTVDQNGTVSAAAGVTEGSAVITATTKDGGFTATCTVKVGKKAILKIATSATEFNVTAVTVSGQDIIVEGCEEPDFDSGWQATLHIKTGVDTVILKGDIKKIEFSSPGVAELDLQNLPDLEELSCDYNATITKINVKGLTELKSLACTSMSLTSLEVQGAGLTKLDCTGNQLTSLDVRGLPDLKELNCSYNQLISLEAQGLTKLKKLDCNTNQLTSLDLGGLTALEDVDCNENPLTSLNVQGSVNLRELKCYVTYTLENLDVQGLTKLEVLYCYSNKLKSLNVQGLTALKALSCSDNDFESLDVHGLTKLQTLDCGGNNKLQSLDLSGTTGLLEFRCTNTDIESFDLSGAPNLRKLTCKNNKLTSLDVKALKDLRELDCSVNRLTSLDVSDIPKLRQLVCNNNELTNLIVTNTPRLKVLTCYNNKLPQAVFTQLFTDLPTRVPTDYAACKLYRDEYGVTEENYKPAAGELNGIKTKNWTPQKFTGLNNFEDL